MATATRSDSPAQTGAKFTALTLASLLLSHGRLGGPAGWRLCRLFDIGLVAFVGGNWYSEVHSTNRLKTVWPKKVAWYELKLYPQLASRISKDLYWSMGNVNCTRCIPVYVCSLEDVLKKVERNANQSCLVDLKPFLLKPTEDHQFNLQLRISSSPSLDPLYHNSVHTP